ncbi:MAG: hypothetical protein WD852_09825 [Methyloceanibacter sp.]
MHYKISREIVIKTENAAKPESQSSSYLKALILSLPTVDSSFDCGCGKLRYRDVILETTNTLAIVDSEIQLSRQQSLKGQKISIRDKERRSNRVTVHNDDEFKKLKQRFDRGYCINVLSVIPFYVKRKEVVEVIRSKLKRNGSCLFVVQYRNSDFSRMQSMPNARPFRDGFLIDSMRGFSFYGLIKPERLQSLVEEAGFLVHHVHLNEGSVYLCAIRK